MEYQPHETTIHDGEQAMQQACIASDLSTLQTLLQYTSGPTPSIHALLKTAVTHQHSNIVAYLLTTYPTLSLSQHTDIAESLSSSGNVSILKILLAHDQNFASISLDSGMRTFLTEACLSPPLKSGPLIHVLLDAGADVNDGLGPGGGALSAALRGGQEKDVVVKIVRKGGYVSKQVIHCAVEKERVDILPLLLRVGGGIIEEEELGKRAKKTGNEVVEGLVESFREGGIKGMAKYKKESEEKVGNKMRW
jgi:hypothetical protein